MERMCYIVRVLHSHLWREVIAMGACVLPRSTRWRNGAITTDPTEAPTGEQHSWRSHATHVYIRVNGQFCPRCLGAFLAAASAVVPEWARTVEQIDLPCEPWPNVPIAAHACFPL